MTRTISLTSDDVKHLEADIVSKGPLMTPDQKQFLKYLVTRAKAGNKASPEANDPFWTWTYRF